MNNTINNNQVDQYIKNIQDSKARSLVEEIRRVIKITAPEASEMIKYKMPTFYLNGNLIHYAANKNHIGLYPSPSAIIAFKDELKLYVTSKGAIQFPINQPLPIELITKIVKFRMIENLKKKQELGKLNH